MIAIIKITTTKHQIYDQDKLQLMSKCPRMKSLIEYVGNVDSFYIEDHFIALVSSITYQSISYKAASAIWERFLALFKAITPQDILSVTHGDLRGVGLSNSKAQYIINVANAFNDKSINLDFNNMSNNEVLSELQKIKGIGPWTSEMFLIFCLYRKDVISYGDIAIRRGIEFLYHLDHDLTKDEFIYYKNLYAPHLTIASFYLWEITLKNLFTINI